MVVEERYPGMPVLVAGGAGFLGSALARRLAALGARVTVVDSFDPRCGGNDFNLSGLEDRVSLHRQEIGAYLAAHGLGDSALVFNCMGLADHHLGQACPETDYELNCATGLALLRQARAERAGCRIVSLGARNQYGAGASHLDEGAPLAPLDVQAVHKTALEHYHRVFARTAGIRYAFVRLTNTYGPGQRMRGDGIGFAAELLRAALESRPVVVYGGLERVKDLLFVADAAEALLRLGAADEEDEEPWPVYNLGGSPCRVGDLVRCLEAALGSVDLEVRPFPPGLPDAGDTVLDCGKLDRATGWRPRTALEEGVAATLDYYRRHRDHYW